MRGHYLSIEIMGKNLGVKAAFIVGVLLVFCYGIVGIPHGGLKQSILDRIHLGLDLQGGVHLVLEVHVPEAVASATDRDAARLQDDLQKAGIVGATVGKTDPAHPQTIVVSGVPVARQSDVRGIMQGSDYQIYDLGSMPDGSLTLTMKLSALNDLAARTVETSIETIRARRQAWREASR